MGRIIFIALNLKEKCFVNYLTKSWAKIECINKNYFLVEDDRKIRLLCSKTDNSPSITTINDVLYFSEIKPKLLSVE